ncbi:hypothetical protein BY996DRAFT_4633242 [Phakopsora pachyrhizi]|nr:hypothetical protein BY996DRAFT_4633242 [Phakopsora pachyrhizi]
MNTVQNYLTPGLTKRVYNHQTQLVTSLQSRTFSVWTFTSGLIRIYTAYNIRDPALYQLSIGTFLIALTHFLSELIIFKSTRLLNGIGIISPLVVASVSCFWMVTQYNYYIS